MQILKFVNVLIKNSLFVTLLNVTNQDLGTIYYSKLTALKPKPTKKTGCNTTLVLTAFKPTLITFQLRRVGVSRLFFFTGCDYTKVKKVKK